MNWLTNMMARTCCVPRINGWYSAGLQYKFCGKMVLWKIATAFSDPFGNTCRLTISPSFHRSPNLQADGIGSLGMLYIKPLLSEFVFLRLSLGHCSS